MDKLVGRRKATMPADGEACYFPRDLSRGSFGGDVYCLQHFLKKNGSLNEAPSGYYGEKTERAVEKWQQREHIRPANGMMAFASRARYAKTQGLPMPRAGSGAASSSSGKDAEGKERTCIDVCSEHSGVQVRRRGLAGGTPAEPAAKRLRLTPRQHPRAPTTGLPDTVRAGRPRAPARVPRGVPGDVLDGVRPRVPGVRTGRREELPRLPRAPHAQLPRHLSRVPGLARPAARV